MRKLFRRSSTILEPFTRRATSNLLRGLALGGLAFFCFFYGAFFALFAPYMIVPLLAILGVPLLLIIWALPETKTVPTRTLEWLFFALFFYMVLWPNYLAIVLPGMPWLTLSRMFQTPFAVVLLVCLSCSVAFRQRVWEIVSPTGLLTKLILVVVVLQTISVAFSADKSHSLTMLFLVQIGWTAAFFISAYVFSQPGKAERAAGIVCLVAFCLCLIGLVEFRLGRAPWVGHIPSFLQVNDPTVTRILAGSTRAGYRVQATFSTSLGFAEYLAYVFPFAVYFVVEKFRPHVKAAGILAAGLIFLVILMTQARIGFVGVVFTCIAYPLIWGFIRWRRDKQHLIAATMVYLSPLLAGAAVAAVFVVPGIRYRVLGGGVAQMSTQARIEQLHMGIPKILSHPWGYGIGQGAITLNYHSPGGLLTIDSYWLKATLEYGLVGLVILFSLYVVGLLYAARAALTAPSLDREAKLLIPISVTLMNFLLIKTAFAGEENGSFLFVCLGMMAALYYRTTAVPSSTPAASGKGRTAKARVGLAP